MKLHHVRFRLVVLLFCLSLLVLLLSSWPLTRQQDTILLPTLSLPTPQSSFMSWKAA